MIAYIDAHKDRFGAEPVEAQRRLDQLLVLAAANSAPASPCRLLQQHLSGG
jgi:hypothetical protein